MKKRQVLLSEAQWEILAPLFPTPKRRKDGRGRPWASNRSCFEGILWVLRLAHGGATCRGVSRWLDLLAASGVGRTGCVAEGMAALLARLDERKLLDWEEAFLDATFVMAKKGAAQSERPVAGKVRSAWWWSTARVYLSERNLRPRRSPSSGLRKARWRG